MNFFWGNVFEYFKDRRLGAVFFGWLVAVFAMLVLGIIFYRFWPFVLTAFGLWLLVAIVREIHRWQARQRNRYKSSPLSRDELAKARSKLKTNSTFKFKS